MTNPLSNHDRAELLTRLRAAQDAATDENEKNLLRAKRLRLEAGKVKPTGTTSLIELMGGQWEIKVVWDGEFLTPAKCAHVADVRHEMQFGEKICAECGANIK